MSDFDVSDVEEVDDDSGDPAAPQGDEPDTAEELADSEEMVGEEVESQDFIDDDEDDDEYLTPKEPNPYLPWILLGSAWGVFILVLGDLILWLELTEEATMAELRAMRPQMSMQVPPPKQPLRSSQSKITAPASGTAAAATEGSGTSSDSEQPQLAESGETASTATEATTNGIAAQQTTAPQLETVAVLHPHPDPELVEKGELGPLPIVDAAGRQPWRVYSRPFNALGRRPRIAIVITNLGVSATSTQSAIQELPGAVSLAFAPYARRLDEWIDAARAAGHEVVITLPMEPLDYPRSDPGPYGLLTTLDAEQNLRRLEWVLSRFTGYVGVTNFLGSRFTTDAQALRPTLVELKRRGLMFVDGRDNPLSVAPRLATEIGLTRGINDIFLDQQASRIAIDAQLEEVEKVARRNGAAVAFGQPFPITISRLKRWIRKLNERGLVLAPVSAVAGRQKNR